MEDEFGPLDWYRAKTVEQMRSDLVTMAEGNYFDDNQEYAFMSGGNLVIRTGAELNDQAPEGPGPEEYQMMSDEEIVEQYVTRIKMYPPFVDIEDKEGFASAFLPALDNMNNVASVYGNDVKYGDGMTLASEIQTGAITDYIATGFKDKAEFFEWYLRDVANNQVVLQPGQTQAEDFSVVDEGFYDDPMTTPNTRFAQKPVEEPIAPPNTRFERNPRIQSKDTVFKQPGKNYYNMLKTLTKVGEAVREMPSATADFLGSAARGPVELGKKVVENVQQGMETAQKGPSLLEIIERLRNNPGSMNIPTEE